MWTGLWFRSSIRAAAAAVSRTMVLPVTIFGLLITFAALVRSPFGDLAEGHSPAIVWIIIGLVNDLLFGFWARHRLLHEFRSIATEKYDKRSRQQRQAGSMRARHCTQSSSLPGATLQPRS